MNFHQTPEEIIKNANAEQRILWNDIFLRYGSKIGISQLSFSGTPVATEFLTYSANKLYFCLCFSGAGVIGAAAVGSSYTFYDSINAIKFYGCSNHPVWDTTAAALKYQVDSFQLRTFTFSRFSGNWFITFLGYRLTI